MAGPRNLGIVALTAAAVVSLGAGLMPAIAQPDDGTLFLAGPAHPESFFRASEPVADSLADLDRGRDPALGLTLLPGGDPVRETDDARHQNFILDASGYTLEAAAMLTIWVSSPEQGDVTIVAHIMDCDQFSIDCVDLGGGEATVPVETAGEFTMTEVMLDLAVSTFGERRTLVLSVTNGGADPLWLGYDARPTPSRLTLDLVPPPTTTTTLATTTTSLATTTTTTVGPPTPVATFPPTTTPPPTVEQLTTTTTRVETTTTTAPAPIVGDDDTLARFVFDYSMASGGTSMVTDSDDEGVLDRFIGGWGPFAATMRAVSPWLAALTVFAVAIAYGATREREGS